MSDLISRRAIMKEFADFVRESNNSDFAQTPTWNDAVSLVGSMPSVQPKLIKAKIGHEPTADETESLKKKLLYAEIGLLPPAEPEIISLPSAQPERKKGKWMHNGKSGTFKIFTCDQCGWNSEAEFNFCPNCGADMRGDRK